MTDELKIVAWTNEAQLSGAADPKWSGTPMAMWGAGDCYAKPNVALCRHDEAKAEIDRLRQENNDLRGAIDSTEVNAGLTSNGNLWRYWSHKAKETAVNNGDLRQENEALRKTPQINPFLTWCAPTKEPQCRTASTCRDTLC